MTPERLEEIKAFATDYQSQVAKECVAEIERLRSGLESLKTHCLCESVPMLNKSTCPDHLLDARIDAILEGKNDTH